MGNAEQIFIVGMIVVLGRPREFFGALFFFSSDSFLSQAYMVMLYLCAGGNIWKTKTRDIYFTNYS